MKSSIHILWFALLLLTSCQKQTEKKQLESELEQLRPKAAEQSLKRELEEIEKCTVKGSVFIVTRGGQNYKLGLVPVVISGPDEMKQHLDATFAALESIAEKDKKAFDPLSASLTQTLIDAQPELDNYSKASEQFATALKRLEQYADVYESFHDVTKKYEAESRQYQQAAEQVVQAKSQLENAARALKPKLDVLTQIHARVLSSYYDILSFLAGHLDLVFRDLPATYSLKTDADGKFSANLPRGSSMVVSARATRLVGKDSEKYFWMTTVEVPEGDEVNLFLSNDNLIENVAGYSSRLNRFLPSRPEDLPDFDLDTALAKWDFNPPVLVAVPLQPSQGADETNTRGTTRQGSVLSIGSSLSAEILDNTGVVTGLLGLSTGIQVEIKREDDSFIYFEQGGQNLRLSKDKIASDKTATP